MTKQEAHLVLDKAKIDRLVPIKDINQALLTLGDLDVRSIDQRAYESLRTNGNESCYIRSRQASSPFFAR